MVSSPDIPIIDVDINSLTEDASLFFDTYHSVILETTNENIIGDINHIDIDSNHIVIASGHDIHLFDKDGTAKNSFNKFGQGPDEYIELSDIKLAQDKILLLSRPMKKIFVYDFNGICTDIYQLPYYYTTMAIEGDNIWLASETSNESKYEFARYVLS